MSIHLYRPYLATLLLLILLSTAPILSAQEITLEATPSKCVALHQGQMCYSTVTFDWQPQKGALAQETLCLHEENIDRPLACWQGKERLSFEHHFESSKSLHYFLRLSTDNKPLASTKVSVAWVYKSSRKSQSGWRMF